MLAEWEQTAGGGALENLFLECRRCKAVRRMAESLRQKDRAGISIIFVYLSEISLEPLNFVQRIFYFYFVRRADGRRYLWNKYQIFCLIS